MPDPVAYILEIDVYKAAILTAKAKNRDIDYAELREGLWTLAYNPATEDALFVRRLDLLALADGYYEAYPLNTVLPLDTRAKVLSDLAGNGWPAIEGI